MNVRRNNDHTFAVCAYGESPYLEACVKSLLHQTVKTNILIATSTPNQKIDRVAKKYHLPVLINTGETGITQDWNFAIKSSKTKYVTVAHQDDYYASTYVEEMLSKMERSEKPLIFFTDYAEIRGDDIVSVNKLLCIKRILLLPMVFRPLKGKKWAKRAVLALGSPICCPSVTFALENLPETIFMNHFRADEDWEAWERISRLDGDFLFSRKVLTLHRIHSASETTKIINDHKRTEEDLVMFRKFWPEWVARLLQRLYRNSEKSNAAGD